MTLVRKLRVHPCSKSLLEVESKEHCPVRSLNLTRFTGCALHGATNGATILTLPEVVHFCEAMIVNWPCS